MNTVETKQVTYVQTAIDRINHYLKNGPLNCSTLSFKDDILTIHFQSNNPEDNVLPTDEQLQYIKNIVFWDSQIELPYEGNIIQYTPILACMTINMKYYATTSIFFEKIKSFGVKVFGFDIEGDSFCFFYSVGGRYHFSYNELEQLQEIINPSIKNHDSIRIVGFDGTYTVRVKINQ